METIGSLIDKLNTNELKIYHTKEEESRTDMSEELRAKYLNKLSILTTQREDLIEELQELIDDVLNGRKQLKLYRQLKMYNDKKFQKKD